MPTPMWNIRVKDDLRALIEQAAKLEDRATPDAVRRVLRLWAQKVISRQQLAGERAGRKSKT